MKDARYGNYRMKLNYGGFVWERPFIHDCMRCPLFLNGTEWARLPVEHLRCVGINDIDSDVSVISFDLPETYYLSDRFQRLRATSVHFYKHMGRRASPMEKHERLGEDSALRRLNGNNEYILERIGHYSGRPE